MRGPIVMQSCWNKAEETVQALCNGGGHARGQVGQSSARSGGTKSGASVSPEELMILLRERKGAGTQKAIDP